MGDNAMAELESAWDEHDEPDVEPEVIPDGEPELIQPEEHSEDPEESAIGGSEDLEPPAGDSEPVLSGDEPPAVEPPSGDADSKPPVSLPAAAREAWKDTPKAMQDAIGLRETQFAQGIQKYAEGFQRSQAMDKALQPFQQYFAMNGNQPAQSIGLLLQTASALQMGNPTQQAQTVADLIKQFGVSVEVLDKLLIGEAPPEPPPGAPGAVGNPYIQQQVAQAVAPYQQFMQQHQQRVQQDEQQVQQEAGNDVTTFGQDTTNEFYNDVRADMADILDMGANRGMQLSLKEAYDRACMLNPEIQRILQSRATQASLANKGRAASSVRGNMGGPGSTAPADSMRGSINDAWDNAGRT